MVPQKSTKDGWTLKFPVIRPALFGKIFRAQGKYPDKPLIMVKNRVLFCRVDSRWDGVMAQGV
jgi:hypothetical protein